MKTLRSFTLRTLVCLLLLSMILTACGQKNEKPDETTTGNTETTTDANNLTQSYVYSGCEIVITYR